MNKKSKNNLLVFIGEFIFVMMWVFSGMVLAYGNAVGGIVLFLFAWVIYGETWFKVTQGLIKPIWRGLK